MSLKRSSDEPVAHAEKRRRSDLGDGGAGVESRALEHSRALLDWLREHGADLGSLNFKTDGRGGIGAFASRDIATGEVLSSIPLSCVLRYTVAKESEYGRTMTAAAQEWECTALCTPEVVLWVYMAVGRHVQEHPFYAYLSALPSESPDPVCWSSDLITELADTPVGRQIKDVQEKMGRCYDQLISRLTREHSDLFPPSAVGLSDVLWARGMCISRQFTSGLMDMDTVDSSHEEGEAVFARGLLLPLLDLLNHRLGQPIVWAADGQRIAFKTGDTLKEGEEVYSNYGARPNEEMLFSYGFSIVDNPMDAVLLRLGSSAAVESSVFYIRRLDQGGVPVELWQALAAAFALGDDNAEGEAEELVVGLEEVEMLFGALQQRQASLDGTKAADITSIDTFTQGMGVKETRRYHIALYRQGMREVLSENLAQLNGMLPTEESEQ